MREIVKQLPVRDKMFFFKVYGVIVALQSGLTVLLIAVFGDTLKAISSVDVLLSWPALFGLLHSSLWYSLIVFGVTRLIDRVRFKTWDTDKANADN